MAGARMTRESVYAWLPIGGEIGPLQAATASKTARRMGVTLANRAAGGGESRRLTAVGVIDTP